VWRANLALILPKRQKLARGHHPALAYQSVPQFVASLREQETTARLCLEFLVQTATRLSECRLALWEEFDTDTATWTIPPNRMKAGVAHRVPLAGPGHGDP
jgi:integrase